MGLASCSARVDTWSLDEVNANLKLVSDTSYVGRGGCTRVCLNVNEYMVVREDEEIEQNSGKGKGKEVITRCTEFGVRRSTYHLPWLTKCGNRIQSSFFLPL